MESAVNGTHSEHSGSDTEAYTFFDIETYGEPHNKVEDDLLQQFKLKEGSRATQLMSKCTSTTLAGIFSELSALERIELFKELPHSPAILLLLRPSEQGVVLDEMNFEEANKIFSQLNESQRVTLFQHLNDGVVQKLRPLMTKTELELLEYFQTFPQRSVGRIMKPISFLPYVRSSWNIDKVQDYIEKEYHGQLLDCGSPLFVLEDEGNKLVGIIPLLALHSFIEKESTKKLVSEIMEQSFFSLNSDTELKEILIDFQKLNGMIIIPVTSVEGLLCGYVAMHDILRYAEEEGRKDLQAASSLEPIEVSYASASLWLLFRKRVIWLVILVLINLASTFVIGAFEEVLEANIELSYFIPLLIGTGGNAGAQTATLLITSLNMKDIGVKDWHYVWPKEILMGIVLGVMLAIGVWIMAFFRGGALFAVAVALSMLTIVSFATNMGVLLPFLAILCRQDPIVASSPLITSLLDISGIAVYFAIATGLLDI